jgi:hypothetical protein
VYDAVKQVAVRVGGGALHSLGQGPNFLTTGMGRISSTNRNFLLSYILLVGVPFLGLAGVLKAGRALRAPVSVDGNWILETNTSALCGQGLQKSVLSVSQSGKGFIVSLDKTTGVGTLAETTMDATLALPATAADHCGNDATLLLHAVIDPKAETRTMLGTISVNDCPSCPQVSYRAVRQTSARKEAH